jgi:hypothetical protein
MFCVIFNSAAPAGAGTLMATRRGGAAQEEKKSATRTTARNPNVRSFTVSIPAVASGKRLKAARRESCRIVRHLGSGIVSERHRTRPLERSESLIRCLGPLGDRWPITFSRNLAPDFSHYLSERPEMSSQDESSRKAKTMKGN